MAIAKLSIKKWTRKAYFFTMVAVIILAIVTVLFFANTKFNEREKQAAVETRIVTMNDFLKDLYNDIDRAAYISGYRTFIAMEEYMAQEAVFFNDSDAIFLEIFANGTLDGDYQEIMNDSSLEDYMRKVNNISNRISINLTLNLTNVSLSHDTPWAVNITMEFTVLVNDTSNIAGWDTNKTIVTTVPIVDLRDPLYTVQSKGRLPRTVRRFNETIFVNDTNDANNTHWLEWHANNTYYINSTRGPSFLMRFANNMSPSPYGIESIVPIPDLNAQDIDVYPDRSVVDFMYFNETPVLADVCDIQNMLSWFKLDEDSRPIYQVELTTLTNGTC